jgi:RNA methyltransferase, TrmH family
MLTKADIKELKSLQQKKYRDDQECFLIEGKRSVEEAINYNHGIELVLMSYYMADKNETLIKKLDNLSIRYEILNAKEIDSISDVQNSQGIVAKVNYLDQTDFQLDDGKKTSFRIIILDAVADPGNMGTIIRTADWFGIDGIIACNSSVDIYNPKVVRSTMGSLLHIPIIISTNAQTCIKKLKDENFKIFAADLEGSTYNKIGYPLRTAIVFGNEAHGISAEISEYIDQKITIPRKGNAESLNVAISAGIIMEHICS